MLKHTHSSGRQPLVMSHPTSHRQTGVVSALLFQTWRKSNKVKHHLEHDDENPAFQQEAENRGLNMTFETVYGGGLFAYFVS